MKDKRVTLDEFTAMLDLDAVRKIPRAKRAVHCDVVFRDTFGREFPELDHLDVLLERNEPRPLAESGRLAELAAQGRGSAIVNANEKLGRTVLQRLHADRWLDLYDVNRDGTNHTGAEIWLLQHGPAVEFTQPRYQLAVWVALDLAAGRDPIRQRGGCQRTELRLADPLARPCTEPTQLDLFGVAA